MNKLNELITNRIQNLKDEKQMSWEKLAYSAGLSKSGVCKVKNQQSIPSLLSLYKICNALDISINDFLNFDFNVEEIE